MSDLNLDVDFVLNTPEALAEAERVKNGIADVGKSAIEANAKIAEAGKSISVLSNSELSYLQKMKDAKKAIYDDAAKSLEKPIAPAANNLPKAVDQVNKLTSAQKASNAAQLEGGGILSDLIGKLSLWGIVASAVTGIFNLYKKEIISWVNEVVTGQKENEKLTKTIEAQSEALGSSKYKNAIANVVELTQMVSDAKDGIIDQDKVVKEYNETMGKTAGVVNSVVQVQQMLVDKGDAYIQMVLNQAAANIVLEKAAQAAADAEQRKVNGATFADKAKGAFAVASAFTFGKTNDLTYADYYNNQLKRSKNFDIENFEKDAKQGVDLYKELTKASNEFAKANGLNSFNDSKFEKLKKDPTINERKNLLRQLEALDNEYKRKSFAKDEEEIQALKDKFARIRAIITEFNKKNPKSAISLVEFNSTEVVATDDLKYRQSTNKLKTSLDEQKKLYEDFENYKTMFGLEKAKERFSGQINTEKTELEMLKQAYAITMAQGYAGGFTAPIKERLSAIGKVIKTETEAEQKRNDGILKQFESYSQERIRIQEKYLKIASDLRSKGYDGEAKRAINKGVEAVKELDSAYLTQTKVFKKLAEEVFETTKQKALSQAKILKDLIASGQITGQAKNEIEKQLGVLEVSLKIGTDQANLTALQNKLAGFTALLNGEGKDDDGNTIILNAEQTKLILSYIEKIKNEIAGIDLDGDGKATFGDKVAGYFKYLKKGAGTKELFEGLSADLGQVSGAFGDLSNSLGGVNTEAGYTLDTIGQLVGVASDAAGAAASFASGDIIGGITKTIKAVAGIFSIGKKVKEMNAAARKEVEDFYASAISGERAYQELLTERTLKNIRDNKIVLQGIRDEIALRKTQLSSYAKETAEIMSKLQGQSFISSQSYTHGTWFRKASTNKTYSSLAGKSFAELSQLLSQGKLEASAKALVERLVELEQKGYDAEQAMADLAKETSELFTGTTADNLTNKLADMFGSGKTGAQDLADFFKEAMDDAAMSIFKNKVLSDMMLKFYDEFDKAAQSDDSLTDVEVEKLKVLFLSLTDEANKKFNDLKKVTGSNLISPSANPSSLTGGIRQAQTEETGNKIEGISRAQYEVQKQTYVLHTNGLDIMKRQLLANERTAAATENAVTRLDTAIDVLTSIKDNTQPKLIPR